MTLSPELIDSTIEKTVLKTAEDQEISDEHKAFLDAAAKSKELVRGMGLMTSLMVKSVMSGEFEGALSSCLVLIYLGYAIAKEEAKEVALAGAIQ